MPKIIKPIRWVTRLEASKIADRLDRTPESEHFEFIKGLADEELPAVAVVYMLSQPQWPAGREIVRKIDNERRRRQGGVPPILKGELVKLEKALLHHYLRKRLIRNLTSVTISIKPLRRKKSDA